MATNHRVNRVTLGSQPASVPSHLQVLTRRVYAPRGPNARASRSLLPLEQSQPAVRCGTAPLQSAPCDTPRLGQSPIPVRVCPVVLPHPPRYFIARTFCIPKSAHRNTFPRRLNGTTTVKHQPPWTTWPKGWEALGSRSLRGHRNSPAVPGRRKTGRFCGLNTLYASQVGVLRLQTNGRYVALCPSSWKRSGNRAVHLSFSLVIPRDPTAEVCGAGKRKLRPAGREGPDLGAPGRGPKQRCPVPGCSGLLVLMDRRCFLLHNTELVLPLPEHRCVRTCPSPSGSQV